MSIVIRNLCKRFGDTPVLQDFTWTVDGPAVLMGRSGCGKTTLLRILMGLEALSRAWRGPLSSFRRTASARS